MAKKRNPASLRSIADKAGLSLGAVSMAMRGDTSIPVKTRERVLAVAKELGYQRNARVSELMTLLKKQSLGSGVETLALVQAESSIDRVEKPYLEETITNVKRRAREKGYGIEVFEWGANGLNSGRFQQIIKARGIRGVIFGMHQDITGAVPFDCDTFAAQVIGYSVVEPPMHRVVIDHYRNVRLVMAQLLARGYKRVGLTIRPETNSRSRDLVSAGFIDMSRRLPVRDRILPLVEDPDEKLITKWRRKHKPDAVIAVGGEWFRYLCPSGETDPEKFGVAYLDSPGGETENIAGVPYQNDKVAEVAVDQLISALQANEFGVPEYPRTIAMTCRWKDGPTVRELQAPVEDPLYFLPKEHVKPAVES
jgi:DNA-binding LacI/PurR family transcriptional regulator